jgi:hypothetical protein
VSTKIYTGFRFRTAKLPAIHAEVMAFRADLAAMERDALVRETAEMTCYEADKDFLAGKPLAPAAPYWRAREKVQEANKDRQFNIVIIPHKGRVLGMTFAKERGHEVQWFAREHMVEPWPYWNNTDRPGGVTQAAWDRRGRTWDEALAPTGIPSTSGFTAACLPVYPHFVTFDEALASAPTKLVRAHTVAVDRLFEEFCKTGDTGESHISRFMEFAGWLKTPEAVDAKQAETARMKGLLPDDYPRDVLFGGKA